MGRIPCLQRVQFAGRSAVAERADPAARQIVLSLDFFGAGPGLTSQANPLSISGEICHSCKAVPIRDELRERQFLDVVPVAP